MIIKQDQTVIGDEGSVPYDIREAFGKPRDKYRFENVNSLVATATKSVETNNWSGTTVWATDPAGHSKVMSYYAGGNTPITNVYDPDTNRDTRWNYDGAGNRLQARGPCLGGRKIRMR